MCRIQCDILIFILQSVLSFYIIFCTFLSFKRKQKNKGIAWYIRKITTFFKSNGFVVHCLVIILDGPKKKSSTKHSKLRDKSSQCHYMKKFLQRSSVDF